ncbi:MAG: hypothetical protein ABI091_08315 [Ferruginibacter sp.]
MKNNNYGEDGLEEISEGQKLKRFMSKRGLNIFIFIVFILICAWNIFNAVQERNSLKKLHLFGSARIESCSSGGRGSAGRLFVNYSILIKDKIYEGSSTYLTGSFSKTDCNNFFIGKTFPVIFSPNNPSNAKILIFPNDFKEYNYSFPDSLNWVLKYIKM